MEKWVVRENRALRAEVEEYNKSIEKWVEGVSTKQTEYNKKWQAEKKMRKEKNKKMEENMTDKQLETILKMIVQIIKDSDTKEDAAQKIEALIPTKE